MPKFVRFFVKDTGHVAVDVKVILWKYKIKTKSLQV